MQSPVGADEIRHQLYTISELAKILLRKMMLSMEVLPLILMKPSHQMPSTTLLKQALQEQL